MRARPGAGGAYLLVLRLGKGMEARVGSLGEVRFPRGTYVYAGSALASLEARVARHFRRGKREHWHIDRLAARADPLEALVMRSQEDLECLLNEMVSRLDGARPLVPGFGCSDCRCPTHLHLVGGQALARLEEFMPERILPGDDRLNDYYTGRTNISGRGRG